MTRERCCSLSYAESVVEDLRKRRGRRRKTIETYQVVESGNYRSHYGLADDRTSRRLPIIAARIIVTSAYMCP